MMKKYVFFALIFFHITCILFSAQSSSNNSPANHSEENIKIIVSGNSSVLYYKPTSFLTKNKKTISSVFSIRTIQYIIPEIHITSTGLGKATFLVIKNNRTNDGLKKTSNGRDILKIKDLDSEGIDIEIRISTESLKNTGSYIMGNIIVYVPSNPITEVPIKVMRTSKNEFTKAFESFGGILIPAVMTFLIGLGGYKLRTSWTSYQSEIRTFSNYKIQNHTRLVTFFEIFYKQLYEANKGDSSKFVRELYNEIVSRQIIEQIPQKYKLQVTKGYAKRDKKIIVKALTSNFPEWEKFISSAIKDE